MVRVVNIQLLNSVVALIYDSDCTDTLRYQWRLANTDNRCSIVFDRA